MAVSNGTNPQFDGLTLKAFTLTPDDSASSINSIPPSVRVVRLGANVNGVTDFTVLPALSSVPDGHQITIIAGAANSELRTPADSDEEINSENADGTKEALLTATNIYTVTKIDNTIGWMLEGRTAIGAYEAAIVPD
jgi:hypothetical protein